MRILVLAPYYWPDGGAAATQFTLLCEGLATRGHQVCVIAGVPHYPSGRVPPEFRQGKRRAEMRNGVRIIRVALPSIDRARMPLRLLQFAVYQFAAWLVGRRETYDVLMMYGPALEMYLPFRRLGVARGVPILYSVHDIYPDVGVKLGVFRNKAIINMVDRMERYCLNHADRLRILSSSFEGSLLSKGVPRDKIHLVYDWVDTASIQPLPRENEFALEHDLVDHFVVLYTGNMGYVQALDNVIRAAAYLEDEEDILFAFVGEGAARGSLQGQAQEAALANVRFIGWQPASRMAQVYASGDACLVSLKEGMAYDALPSKTFAIMAAGRPVIASLDPGSDAWNTVERAAAGVLVPPDSPRELADAVLSLRNDRQLSDQYAQKGRQYVVAHHSPESAALAFEAILQGAIAGSAAG